MLTKQKLTTQALSYDYYQQSLSYNTNNHYPTIANIMIKIKFKKLQPNTSNFSGTSDSLEDSFSSIANSSVDFGQKVKVLFQKNLEQEQQQMYVVRPPRPPSSIMASWKQEYDDETNTRYHEAAARIEMWRAQRCCEDDREFRKLQRQLREGGGVTSTGSLTLLLNNRAQARLQQFYGGL